MYKKIKRIVMFIFVITLSLQTINADVLGLQLNDSDTLKPGEVTQQKTANWSDYGNGIAEISFDVEGKNEEEPMDVVLLYDNSGSMQTSSNRTFSESRWNYASTAAEAFAQELLKSDDNNVMLIPFSDKLIDGNSLHTEPSDYFETHEFIYDENGDPDIEKMQYIYLLNGELEDGRISEEEWINGFESVVGFSPDEMEEVNHTKNAIVPFTNDESKIINAIESLYPSYLGLTNYEVALKCANDALKKSDAQRKIVVMISDGKPTTGGNSLQVANEIKASGATIYTIGTGIKDENASTLKAIASIENGVSLYTSAEPSEISDVLETLRKQFDRAASDAKIEDEINTEYFEYYSDDTHMPTVNDVVIGNDELLVSQDKDHITWKIGNITETKKTLRFFIKVKEEKLNDDLLDQNNSFLNMEGSYFTNKNANLSYQDINSHKLIETGHEMVSPQLSVTTASMKTVYYLSDIDGNYVQENGQNMILKSTDFDHKALYVNYLVEPDSSIIANGKKYIVYKGDNVGINKMLTHNDINQANETSFRYVEQMNVTFDTNGYGEFNGGVDSLLVSVDHDTMLVSSSPDIQQIPAHMHFVGWNTKKDGTGDVFTSNTNVKKNTTVYAQWREDNKYSVIFQDDAGNILKQEDVYEGNDASAPIPPVRDGYIFIGWDIDYTNVTSDLFVTTLWERNDEQIPVLPILPTPPTTPLAPITPVIPNAQTAPILPNVPNVVPVQQNVVPQQEEPTQPEVEIVPENENPKANIKENKTPKANIVSAWALVNLICSVLTVLLVFFILLGKRKKEEENDEQTISFKRRKWTMITSVITAIASAIAFILTEDISLPMILVDKWTILMVIILIVQVVMLFLAKNWKKDKEETLVTQA